jgi:uncharacterized membrane protein
MLLLVAVGVHLLAVWAVPRVIMARVIAASTPAGTTGVVLPPMTDASQRRIVMPSPDLLYALCAFDVGARPLRIRAAPAAGGHRGYWSIALYTSNSDNFRVLNDRQAAGGAVDWVLEGPDAQHTASGVPAGATRVTSPTARGLLLMRVLVTDHAGEREAADAARRSLRCEPM